MYKKIVIIKRFKYLEKKKKRSPRDCAGYLKKLKKKY